MCINSLCDNNNISLVIYLVIDGLAEWLEKRQEERAKLCADTVKCSGLVGFLYLELILP